MSVGRRLEELIGCARCLHVTIALALVAWVEVKQRSCASDQYRTVFMNVGKKFEHLVALSVVAPAFFVVRWADGVTRFIDVADVDSGWIGVGGEHDRWGAGRHDLEPVFEIPVERMRVL